MRLFKIQYGESSPLLLYAPSLAAVREKHPGAMVEKYVTPHLEDNIALIKSKSEYLLDDAARPVYRMPHSDGPIYIKLHCDPEDGADIVLYQQHKIGAVVTPMTWDVTNAKGFVEKFITRKPLTFELISSRRYGEPNLTKPDTLRGVPQSFSVPLNRRCSCPCFVSGDDLWIKCRDYFSPSWQPPANDLGKPTSYYMRKYFGVNYPEKFIYADTRGEIILRNEAWIKLANLIPTLPFLAPYQIARAVWSQICAYYSWHADTQNREWLTFLEAAATAASEFIKKKEEHTT